MKGWETAIVRLCNILQPKENMHGQNKYNKICVKLPVTKRLKVVFQDQLWLNAGQKYSRMLQGEHFAIL